MLVLRHSVVFLVLCVLPRQQPDLSPIDMGDMPMGKRRMMEGYYKISRHYKFALNELFVKMHYESVIIVEGKMVAHNVNVFTYVENNRLAVVPVSAIEISLTQRAVFLLKGWISKRINVGRSV